MEKVLYSTLREHSKDFENDFASSNGNDDKTRWEQLKGKNLTIDQANDTGHLVTESGFNSGDGMRSNYSNQPPSPMQGKPGSPRMMSPRRKQVYSRNSNNMIYSSA